MFSNKLKKLNWLKENVNLLKNIFRGIERETLRITHNGKLSSTYHPVSMGSALTHKWITTDFSENLLEFITPSNNNIDNLLSFLRDIHRFAIRKITPEMLWPFSMPPTILQRDKLVKIAQYGSSYSGKKKMLYRYGLRNRYGTLMNLISGVHYNFSLPLSFWKIRHSTINANILSSEYFSLIRNYLRFGWVIPYLFGASPAIHASYMKNKISNIKFKKDKNNILYLPWATSLRLSNIGHANYLTNKINIKFNSLNEYIKMLITAITTPSRKFVKLGLKDKDGNLKQINTNILQIENEYYAPIRPKRSNNSDYNVTQLTMLKHKGPEYIEIRSLDINPFSNIGISKKQILFLDLFLLWCALIESPKMTNTELNLIKKNWNRIALEGRKPKQRINITSKNKIVTLAEISKYLFSDLLHIAEILDANLIHSSMSYQNICHELLKYFKYPELTYSYRILSNILNNGIEKTGIKIANKFYTSLIETPLEILNEDLLTKEVIRSHIAQKKMENN